MSLIELFFSFVKIGVLSFGGGYAAIPLIQQEVIINNNFLTISQFSDIVAISSMTPGPVGLNVAIMSGIEIYGFIGALVATLGFVVPSLIIMSVISYIYFKHNTSQLLNDIVAGIKPAVIAFIFSAGIIILKNAIFKQEVLTFSNINFIQVFIFIFSLYLFVKAKVSPIKGILIVLIFSLMIQTFNYLF